MTTSPGPLGGRELQEVRDATRRQAHAMSGIGIALVGTLLAGLTMVGVMVLDYHFEQPLHRVLKLIGAGALGIGVLLFPFVGLFAFGVIVPFLPWIPGVHLPGVNALNLLLVTVFTMWLINRVMRGEPVLRSSRLGGVLALMIGLVAVAVFRGAAFPTGYDFDLKEAVIAGVRAAVTLAVFYVALLMARGERSRRSLMWAIVVGLLAESAATILLGRNGRGTRATGSIGQSNDLAAYLAMYAVMAAAMLPAVKNWFGKLVLAAATAAAGFGIILSLSRAGMVAIAVGLFYVGMRSSRALTILLIVVGVTSPLWAPDYLKARITGSTVESENSDEVELESGARLRVDTWRALLQVVEDHPLDGVGFTGLQYVLPETGEALGVDVKDSSHNTFLRMLSEMGIFGLALFLWLLWKCWALGTATMRVAATKFDRQLGVALSAATLVLAITCAFGDRFFNIIVSGAFWIACALGEDVLHEAADRAAGPPPPPVPVPARAAPEVPA